MPLQFPQIVKRLLFPRQTPVGRTDPHEQHPGADRTPARGGKEALEKTVATEKEADRSGGRKGRKE